jgi:putative DNA primase/helicase
MLTADQCGDSNGSSIILERLTTLLPNAVLLPIHALHKGPFYRWPKISFALSKRPRYQRWLKERANTGVVLGERSGNLCAIDVDDDQFLQAFVNLNPDLGATLCSKGARGCQFWLQMEGDYPHCVYKLKTKDGEKWGEWRADGGQSIIRGIHPDGMPYRLLCDAPPLKIHLDDIKWPPNLILPWKNPPVPVAEKPASLVGALPNGDISERVRRYLQAIPASVAKQGGDDQLFKTADILVNGFALSPEQALPFLREYNTRAEPPWPENRLVYKLEQALENPRPDKPFGYLLNATKAASNGPLPAPIGSTCEPYKQIQEKHGAPVFLDKKAETISRINEPFWAAVFAQENVIVHEYLEHGFYLYDKDSGLYVPESDDEARTKLAATLLRASRQWPSLKGIEKFQAAQSLCGVIEHLRGQVKQRNFFKKTEPLVHLANCVLRIESDGFSREAFSPSHRSRNRSPIAYDPKAQCPRFKNELLAPLEDDDKEVIQKYAGQLLLGVNKAQRILLLEGKAGAGKTTLALVLKDIVGAQNIEGLRTEHLEERFEIGRFLDKTLLLGADVKDRFLSSKGAYKLKALVGGDSLPAELKGSNSRFYVEGRFNVLITSNARLRIRLQGDQDAWRRRLTIVRYEQERQNKRIDEFYQVLLREEASGILNWCLKGLFMLFRDLKEFGDIRLSSRQKARVEALLTESDSLKLFLTRSLVGSTGCNVTTNEIIESYYRDCASNQWTPQAVSVVRSDLDDFMLELFGVCKSNCVKRDGKDQRGFFNIRFRQDDEPDPSNQ